MCQFFSAISNGNGKVLFFTLDDIKKIEQEGNKDNYESWNSHTSIAHYHGVKSSDEDKWNKWEYDCEKKELNIDGSLVAKDDRKKVKAVIEKYLADNNAIYCQKIYKRNSGDLNSGNRNSGNRNSGNRNSGDLNSGNRNSGNRNSGDLNSGNWNSGDLNSGNWNSGNRNSGFLNTIIPKLVIFNKETNVPREIISFPDYFYFNLTIWIDSSDMDDSEKRDFPYWEITGGYLKVKEYKEAWKESFNSASKEDVKRTLLLPNFNYKIFEEITGITKKMIDEKVN